MTVKILKQIVGVLLNIHSLMFQYSDINTNILMTHSTLRINPVVKYTSLEM